MVKLVGALVAAAAFLLGAIWFVRASVWAQWIPPVPPTTYASVGSDGRMLAMIFMGRGYAYLIYTDLSSRRAEEALVAVRGSYNVNLMWNLWAGAEPSNFWTSLRWLDDGASSVRAETRVLKKFIVGEGAEALPALGETISGDIVISPKFVTLGDNRMERRPEGAIDLGLLAKNLPLPPCGAGLAKVGGTC